MTNRTLILAELIKDQQAHGNGVSTGTLAKINHRFGEYIRVMRRDGIEIDTIERPGFATCSYQLKTDSKLIDTDKGKLKFPNQVGNSTLSSVSVKSRPVSNDRSGKETKEGQQCLPL